MNKDDMTLKMAVPFGETFRINPGDVCPENPDFVFFNLNPGNKEGKPYEYFFIRAGITASEMKEILESNPEFVRWYGQNIPPVYAVEGDNLVIYLSLPVFGTHSVFGNHSEYGESFRAIEKITGHDVLVKPLPFLRSRSPEICLPYGMDWADSGHPLVAEINQWIKGKVYGDPWIMRSDTGGRNSYEYTVFHFHPNLQEEVGDWKNRLKAASAVYAKLDKLGEKVKAEWERFAYFGSTLTAVEIDADPEFSQWAKEKSHRFYQTFGKRAGVYKRQLYLGGSCGLNPDDDESFLARIRESFPEKDYEISLWEGKRGQFIMTKVTPEMKWQPVAEEVEKGFSYVHPETGEKEIFSFEGLPITFLFRGEKAVIGPYHQLNQGWKEKVFCRTPVDQVVGVGFLLQRDDLFPEAVNAYYQAMRLKREWLFNACLELLEGREFDYPEEITIVLSRQNTAETEIGWALSLDGNIDGIAQVAVPVCVSWG